MILMDGTLEDLKELELCYAPPFGTAKDVLNQAALVGLNQFYMAGLNRSCQQGQGTGRKQAFILDVREKGSTRLVI